MREPAPREWDARAYDALSLPHEKWGRGVLARLPLRGDERVLDIGAGTGRDTDTLLRRLPRGQVIAVDASEAMLMKLRARLSWAEPERLTVLRADLRKPLNIGPPVDAIVSVATLHWLADHSSLFGNLYAVLRPGGCFAAEWGGAGNVAEADEVLGDLGLPRLREIANYATAQRTAERLRSAGFVDVRVDAAPGRVRLPPGPQWDSLMRTVVLGPVLDRLPADQRDSVVTEVATRLSKGGLSYVRLHAAAIRPR